jgi:hypothetical protein
VITRFKDGKLQTFKEGAYKQEPRIQKVIDKLATMGYNRWDARILAKEICQSLDNYIGVQEAVAQQRQRLYDNHTRRPTQTARRQLSGNV